MPRGDPQTDPKGLISESYRMENLEASECRSIFLDWALSLPEGADASELIERLLARHGADAPDHPMTAVLREGQARISAPRRRGGRSARSRE